MPLTNLAMPDGWDQPGPVDGPALVFSETTASYEHQTADQQRATLSSQQQDR